MWRRIASLCFYINANCISLDLGLLVKDLCWEFLHLKTTLFFIFYDDSVQSCIYEVTRYHLLINSCVSRSCFLVRCSKPPRRTPSLLRPSTDSPSAGWSPRRNDSLSFPSDDTPAVWEHALDRRIRPSGPGVPRRLSHRGGLIGGRRQKPNGKRQRHVRRIRPGRVH